MGLSANPLMSVNGLATMDPMKEELAVIDRQRGVCCVLDVVIAPSDADRAAELLRAIADPTRLSILMTLREASQPVCICDFTATFNLGQPTVSHHMGKLRDAGLVRSERRGIWTFYNVVSPLPEPVEAVLSALGS
jgi:ArsR family transcriptional regulator, arsenate/arsenite/antimonite-responsive transcriptional repressor